MPHTCTAWIYHFTVIYTSIIKSNCIFQFAIHKTITKWLPAPRDLCQLCFSNIPYIYTYTDTRTHTHTHTEPSKILTCYPCYVSELFVSITDKLALCTDVCGSGLTATNSKNNDTHTDRQTDWLTDWLNDLSSLYLQRLNNNTELTGCLPALMSNSDNQADSLGCQGKVLKNCYLRQATHTHTHTHRTPREL